VSSPSVALVPWGGGWLARLSNRREGKRFAGGQAGRLAGSWAGVNLPETQGHRGNILASGSGASGIRPIKGLRLGESARIRATAKRAQPTTRSNGKQATDPSPAISAATEEQVACGPEVVASKVTGRG